MPGHEFKIVKKLGLVNTQTFHPQAGHMFLKTDTENS